MESELNKLYTIARGGDQGIQEQLLQRLSERFTLFVQQRVSNEQDVEEIIQDALLAVIKGYRKIAPDASFTAWTYRVLENKLRYYYRTKRNRTNRMVPLNDSEHYKAQDVPDPLFKQKLLDCLKKVNRANSRHARILNLHYQGYSVKEICEKLSITQNNVYIILSRARSMLKTCLKKGSLK